MNFGDLRSRKLSNSPDALNNYLWLFEWSKDVFTSFISLEKNAGIAGPKQWTFYISMRIILKQGSKLAELFLSYLLFLSFVLGRTIMKSELQSFCSQSNVKFIQKKCSWTFLYDSGRSTLIGSSCSPYTNLVLYQVLSHIFFLFIAFWY